VSISITNASFESKVPFVKASEIFLPVGNSGQKISLLDLSRIRIKELENLKGEKMSFSERVGFKVVQKKLRDQINYDGTINISKIKKLAENRSGETGFHAGGFFLGLLLGIIGVLVAYLIKDDYKRNRVKWAWIGWGAWVAILLVMLAAGVSFSVV
jgi:hypothetical protein